jgi:hypothetical protein
MEAQSVNGSVEKYLESPLKRRDFLYDTSGIAPGIPS